MTPRLVRTTFEGKRPSQTQRLNRFQAAGQLTFAVEPACPSASNMRFFSVRLDQYKDIHGTYGDGDPKQTHTHERLLTHRWTRVIRSAGVPRGPQAQNSSSSSVLPHSRHTRQNTEFSGGQTPIGGGGHMQT